VGAVAGLAVHGLPLEELTGYRDRIVAVDIDAVAAAARDHLHVDRAAIVLVGDVDAFGSELERAGLGRLVIDRDQGSAAAQQAPPVDVAAAVGPTDEGDTAGPTAGAEDPSLPGSDDGSGTDGSPELADH
jgi:hypothetical protein